MGAVGAIVLAAIHAKDFSTTGRQVLIIGVIAGLIIMLANRSARLRLLAAGVLVGFGIQTVLLFAGYEFQVRSPDHAGPGGAVGILGGIVFLVAALIAAASRPASAAVTAGP